MQWVRNESHHGLPRMVNAVGTEWVTPWVIKDGECSGYGMGHDWVTEDGECSVYGMSRTMGYQGW